MASPSSLDFRANNAALVRERAPEAMLSGPAGTGKSWACLYKIHKAACEYPGMRAAIVRKTRASVTQSALVTFEQKILGRAWYEAIAMSCGRGSRQSYLYPRQQGRRSEVVVGGLDRASRLLSTEYDLIYVMQAEEIAEGDWESLISRTRNGRMPYQQVFGDCNPDAPSHWIRQRSLNGTLALLATRHEDNPDYYDGRDWTPKGLAYLARLELMTGVRYLRLRKGIWAGVEGQVYDEWDDAVHLVDPFEIPAAWPRYRAIDFGYSNPFVCSWHAVDPDGRAYLYRELYGTGRIVADWASDINRLSEGERIEWTVADHDAEDRATLDAAGIRTLPAFKAVKPGIEAVQKRLRKAGDGRPRLFIMKGCTVNRDPRLVEAKKPASTAEEVGGYVWASPLANRACKEEPQKLNDHGIDALRYVISELDGLGHFSAGAW